MFCMHCGTALHGASVCPNCRTPATPAQGRDTAAGPVAGAPSPGAGRPKGEPVFSVTGSSPASRIPVVIGIIVCPIFAVMEVIWATIAFDDMSYWASSLEKAEPWLMLIAGVLFACLAAGALMEFSALSKAHVRIYRDHAEMMTIPATWNLWTAKDYRPTPLNIGLDQIQGASAKSSSLQIVVSGKTLKAYCPDPSTAQRAAVVLNEQLRAFRASR